MAVTAYRPLVVKRKEKTPKCNYDDSSDQHYAYAYARQSMNRLFFDQSIQTNQA
ncbi:MAG: hypothetical protein ACJAZ6_001474 [Oleispira sp.]|jgi:hypothetical protein|tara:strand:+ start:5715 stop:5876 length:162 start_codon:yes stop_codon:yes gene_type:complete